MPRPLTTALVAGLALAVAGFLVGGALGKGATRAAAYTCDTSKQVTLLDTSNGDAVGNGGTAPTFSTNGKAYCLHYIQTYHWNGGKGQPPGTLGLKRIGGGAGPGIAAAVGPVQAKASSGQNNAPNVNWYMYFDTPAPPPVIDGTYQCEDSGTATWSSNPQSGGRGFCIVQGYLATSSSGGGTGATTTGATTTSTTPTTTTTEKPKPCKCDGITVSLDPTLLRNTKLRPDQQDFGVGVDWTMTCTAGTGGCKGRIVFSPPTILAGSLPKPPGNFKLKLGAKLLGCKGPCGKSVKGRFQIQMKSTHQLNELFGRTLAYTVTTTCAQAVKVYRVTVLVDQQGHLSAGPTRVLFVRPR